MLDKIGHKPEIFNSIYRGVSEGFVLDMEMLSQYI